MHFLQLLSTALADQGSLHRDELIKPLVKVLDVYPFYYLLVLDWLACVRLMTATLYQQLYLFQEKGVLPNDVSFSFSDVDRDIHIFADEGRLQRPVFSKKKFPSRNDLQNKSFQQLVMDRQIIYLDSYQIENSIIAMTPDEMYKHDYFSYCEIHPSLIYGVVLSTIPFSDHNQSVRDIYTGEKIISIKKFDRNKNDFALLGNLSLEDWEDRAVKGNYEILSKREQISAAKKALQSAKYDRHPTVDLNIQLSRGSSESTFFVNSQTKSQSIGLTFFLPIYQGGSINSKIRQTASSLDAEIEGLRFQEEDLRRRVQKTYYGLQDSIELSGSLKSAVKSAMVQLEANRKSATAGIRKQLDILVSQQNLLRVERELIDNNLNVILFWLNLNMLSSSVDRSTIERTNKYFK